MEIQYVKQGEYYEDKQADDKLDLAFQIAVKNAIISHKVKGLPIARYDAKTKTVYKEYEPLSLENK